MTVYIYNGQRPPKIWRCWMRQLGASSRVSRALWRIFLQHHRGEELGLMLRASHRQTRPAVVSMLATLSPQRLLRLCSLLAPEGQQRDKDVRSLEETIIDSAKHPHVWR